ncbi:MAG TPA: hypothetical protein VFC63_11040 [Blastocatellia bacterium]|nr:hypothetical protein [Blastocatellia bacterium]
MTINNSDSRMATESELEQVDNLLHSHISRKLADGILSQPTSPLSVDSAKTGQQKPQKSPEAVRQPENHSEGRVNRFLLCSLVSQSARVLKTSSLHSQSSSVTMIGRKVLRAYLKVSMDAECPLSDSTLDLTRLGLLNKKIVEDELMAQAQKRVDECRVRHTESKQSLDEAKIKVEQGGLSRAIAHRDRLTNIMGRD